MNRPGSNLCRASFVSARPKHLMLAALISLASAMQLSNASLAAKENVPQKPSIAASADVDFGPYMADLQKKIKKAWMPPRQQSSKRVTTCFKVHRDGSISDVRVDSSSGDSATDEAGLNAVRDASPFQKLPEGSPDLVDIQFTFDYNVMGKHAGSSGAAAASADAFDGGISNTVAKSHESNIKMQAESLARDGMKLFNSEHQEDALPELEELYRLVSKNNLSDYTEELSSLGDIYYNNDDYEKALPVYRKVDELLAKKRSQDYYAQASNKRDIAYTLLYSDLSKIDECQKYFHSAQELSKKVDDLDLSSDIACGVGHCLWQKHQYNEAKLQYEQSAELALKSSGQENLDYAQKLKNVADCQYKLHDDSAAFDTYSKVERIDREFGHLAADDEDKELHANLKALSASVKPSITHELGKKENNWWYYAFGGIITAIVLLYLVGRPQGSVFGNLSAKNFK